MKKIIGFLILLFAISLNSYSQTGPATASAQTRSNLLLKYGVDKADSIITALTRSNLLLKYGVDKADSIITALTRSNLLLKYGVDKADSNYTAIKTFTNVSASISGGTVATSANQVLSKVSEDSTANNTQSSELYLKAINESTLTGLSLGSKITYTNNSVIKASAGVLYGFYVYNSNAVGQYIQFFNSTTVPADATAPTVTSFYVPALSNLSFSTGAYGWIFGTGISWSNSSTVQTKTIGASDIQITVTYKYTEFDNYFEDFSEGLNFKTKFNYTIK